MKLPKLVAVQNLGSSEGERTTYPLGNHGVRPHQPAMDACIAACIQQLAGGFRPVTQDLLEQCRFECRYGIPIY